MQPNHISYMLGTQENVFILFLPYKISAWVGVVAHGMAIKFPFLTPFSPKHSHLHSGEGHLLCNTHSWSSPPVPGSVLAGTCLRAGQCSIRWSHMTPRGLPLLPRERGEQPCSCRLPPNRPNVSAVTAAMTAFVCMGVIGVCCVYSYLTSQVFWNKVDESVKK